MPDDTPIDTPALRLLGVRHPIVQAPMAGWTTPELVAAVSNAGGLGSLAAGRLSLDELHSALARVRTLTANSFAVNFLLAPPDDPPVDASAVRRALDVLRSLHGLPPGGALPALPPSELAAQIAATLDAGVRIVSVAMGRPGAIVNRVHDAGAIVIGTATTVGEARILESEGVDAIVAQGAEAGGHRSTFDIGPAGAVPLVGTFVLVPAMADAVRCPVIAAGGIMDARGLVAALALGASAVQLGTRFLLADESGAFPAYRRALLEASEVDTEVTSALTGRPARAIRNAMLDAMRSAGVAPLPWPYQAAAAADLYAAAAANDDAAIAPLLAGQGLRLARATSTAAAIVEELVQDARRLLRAHS